VSGLRTDAALAGQVGARPGSADGHLFDRASHLVLDALLHAAVGVVASVVVVAAVLVDAGDGTHLLDAVGDVARQVGVQL